MARDLRSVIGTGFADASTVFEVVLLADCHPFSLIAAMPENISRTLKGDVKHCILRPETKYFLGISGFFSLGYVNLRFRATVVFGDGVPSKLAVSVQGHQTRLLVTPVGEMHQPQFAGRAEWRLSVNGMLSYRCFRGCATDAPRSR